MAEIHDCQSGHHHWCDDENCPCKCHGLRIKFEHLNTLIQLEKEIDELSYIMPLAVLKWRDKIHDIIEQMKEINQYGQNY